MNKAFGAHPPPGPWDDIVIGSGMGGMTAAALLAKLGRRVLILEQHDVPGGFTHTFKRKKWVWDVGVHAVGEVTERALLGRVLAALTDGGLQWVSLGPIYDAFHFADGLALAFPDSREGFFEVLNRAFPRGRGAIEAYFERVKQVAAEMRGYYASRLLAPRWGEFTERALAPGARRELRRVTHDALKAITPDPRLRRVLTAQWGYYGSPPRRSSFAIHALVARHFWHGGYYPLGGSQRIAENLLATVAAAGGFTRINAATAEIMVKNGQAIGVKLAGGEELLAQRVISAAGALNTLGLLPAEERQRTWAQSIAALPPSPAHLCLNLGFNGDIRQAGASPANQWFYENDEEVWEFGDRAAPAPVLYTSFPSLKNPAHKAEAPHTGEVVTFVPRRAFDAWQDKPWMQRGEDYEALKAELTERLTAQLFRKLPGLKAHLAYAELSTPLSTEHFTRAHGGAIYGLEPTPARFANRYLRPQTPVRALFLAGSDVGTVGVMGAMLGGLLAAIAAEPWAALRYLKKAAGGGAQDF